MKRFTKFQLNERLRLHALWVEGNPEGVRAYFAKADLRRVDFSGADLRRADLYRTDFYEANLFGVII